MKRLSLPLMGLFFSVLAGCLTSDVQVEYAPVSVESINVQVEIGEEELPPLADFVFLPVGADLPASTFGETWAYLISGQEEYLKNNYPLSDVGYFGADVNVYGQLVGVPNRNAIRSFPGRVHLVVACTGQALSNFVLQEGSQYRRDLIAAILEASRPYDGLQIDFENVPARRGDDFRSFLAELRHGLPEDKIFSIAIAARTRTIENDVYDYSKIVHLFDRMLVMAYDEHWSTSAPGPIASMAWCQRVASYSLGTIGREKLIMGLPFYGRTWGDINANRAFFHSGIERIKRENGVSEIQRENGIPNFSYQATLTVRSYYEDAYSLSTRLEMYSRMGVGSVGFWCLGQETPEIWSLLRLSAK